MLIWFLPIRIMKFLRIFRSTLPSSRRLSINSSYTGELILSHSCTSQNDVDGRNCKYAGPSGSEFMTASNGIGDSFMEIPCSANILAMYSCIFGVAFSSQNELSSSPVYDPSETIDAFSLASSNDELFRYISMTAFEIHLEHTPHSDTAGSSSGKLCVDEYLVVTNSAAIREHAAEYGKPEHAQFQQHLAGRSMK